MTCMTLGRCIKGNLDVGAYLGGLRIGRLFLGWRRALPPPRLRPDCARISRDFQRSYPENRRWLRWLHPPHPVSSCNPEHQEVLDHHEIWKRHRVSDDCSPLASACDLVHKPEADAVSPYRVLRVIPERRYDVLEVDSFWSKSGSMVARSQTELSVLPSSASSGRELIRNDQVDGSTAMRDSDSACALHSG
jgi:hypothetical protein